MPLKIGRSAWLALVCVTAACGLDFNRYDSVGLVDASGPGPTDDASDAPPASDGSVETGASETGAAETGGGCATSADCGDAAAVCNTATRQCVECLASSDCRAPTPYCDSQSFTCAASCVSDQECPQTAPHCSPTTAQCVQCTTNTNCSGTTPYCGMLDAGAGTCVQCLQNSQCSFRRPTCTGGKCV
jgi:hypothetical protein